VAAKRGHPSPAFGQDGAEAIAAPQLVGFGEVSQKRNKERLTAPGAVTGHPKRSGRLTQRGWEILGRLMDIQTDAEN